MSDNRPERKQRLRHLKQFGGGCRLGMRRKSQAITTR